jgi:hypothetical protein
MTKAPPGQLTFHTEAEQFLFNRDCLFVLVFLLIFLQRSRPGTSQLVGWECVSDISSELTCLVLSFV